MAIKRCSGCKPHAYQDKKYGNKKRVMNPTSKTAPQEYRCTVCGTTHK